MSDSGEKKLNGSVDRPAEALRDVVSEAVDEKLEPIQRDLEQQGILIRAIAKTIIPDEAMTDNPGERDART